MKRKVQIKDIKKAQKEKMPIFLAEILDDVHVRFWCPFCCEYHHHGHGNSMEPYVLYSRSAHCKTFKKWYEGSFDEYYIYIENKEPIRRNSNI